MSGTEPQFRLHPLHRLWRLLPVHQRRRMLTRTTSFLAPRPDRVPPDAAQGLAVVGELSRASGLGEAARLTLAALGKLGVPAYPIDISQILPGGDCIRPTGIDLPPGVPVLLHVNPPSLAFTLLRLPRNLLRHRRVIGNWAWELPMVPPAWHDAACFVHGLWAPSHFSAGALEAVLPGRVSTVPIPVAIAPPAPSARRRADFGIPANTVVVLVSLNLASSLERKNPLGAVAAFRAAFGDRKDRLLVLKLGNPGHFPEDFALIEAAVAGIDNIRVELRTFPTADNHALTACADIVLSLHRGEGFGLVPAEAMLLGKPVIATGWSGNMDFMDASSAALVDCKMIPVRDARGVHDLEGAVWADPDQGEAVVWLRRLADDPALRASLGARGKAMACERLGVTPMAAALAKIGIRTSL